MVGNLLEVEEVMVDVEQLEPPFLAASQAEITEEVGDELETLVKERLNSIRSNAHLNFTISRVPAQFREKNKTLYEPAMVSIGPFYHRKESLRATEEHKWRFLKSFLARKTVPMEAYLKEMKALEPRARWCYGESVSLGPDEFSLMLLLDGCFILEYLLRLDDCEVYQVPEFNWAFESLQFDLVLLENQIPFFVIHKLFTLWSGTSLDCQNRCELCDLLFKCQPQPFMGNLSWPQISCNKIEHLLEFYYKCLVPKGNSNSNQRQPVVSCKERVLSWLKARFSRQSTEANSQEPVCVLSWLKAQFSRQPTEANSQEPLCVLSWLKAQFSREPTEANSQEPVCVLSWLKAQFSRQPTEANSQEPLCVLSWLKTQFSRQPPEANSQEPVLGVIPCATELHEAGVTFRRKNNPSNMFDITFENGVLEIPHMLLNPYMRIIFTNLFAYEQNLSMTRGIFSNFANVMDSLVNTEKDVVLLERCGIIDNMFQNEEEAATFFNELNDYGFLNPNHHFLQLFREVKSYSKSTCHRYRAKLMHDYFSTPCSSVSVLAGGVLLSLALVQTIFTVYSAFHH